MSTSLLYHAFGILGYQYVRTAYVAGKTIFTNPARNTTPAVARPVGPPNLCPRPGRAELPLPPYPIPPHVSRPAHPARRVPCLWRTVRQVDIGFADPRRSYTRRFERYVLGSAAG